MKWSNSSRHVLSLLVIALLARLFFSYLTMTHPAYSIQYQEELYTVQPAYALAWGKGFVLPQEDSNLPMYVAVAESGGTVPPDAVHGPFLAHTICPPGNAMIGMVLHRLTGKPVTPSFLVFGSVLGTLTVWLVLLTVRQLTGEFRLAYLTAAFYALFPPSIRVFTDLSLLGPASFLVLLALWFFLKSMHQQTFSWGHGVLSAVSVGLIGYFRPDWMLLVPCFVFGWLLSAACSRSSRFRSLILSAFLRLAVMSLVQCIVMTPLALRNLEVTGKFRFSSSNAGWVMYSALGQYPNPWGIEGTDEARYREASQLGFDGPASAEADRYFRQKFIECVKQNPGAYAKILLRRLVFVATPYPWGSEVRLPSCDPDSFVYRRAQAGLLRALPSALKEMWPQVLSAGLMLLALPGMIGLVLNRSYFRRGAPVVLLVFLYGLVIHVLIHVEARYLLPGVFVQLLGLALPVDRFIQPQPPGRGND